LEFIPFETTKDGNGNGSMDGGAGGMDSGAVQEGAWEKEVKEIFTAALEGKAPDAREAESWKTFILTRLAAEYHSKGWAMQLHIAAIRNINSRAFKAQGANTGYDAVHDRPVSAKLAKLLDYLESQGRLPKTIFYSLNFKDFYALGTVMGGFQGTGPGGRPGIPGKMQLGSGWWFLDHKDGMEDQMKLLGNIGLLSRFVGMLTDSRSFLSYPRHEYFRRILCNMLGTWAEEGEIPHDFELLSSMVRDISFGNAQRYFGT
jgi:glucuronate isomerase